MLTLTRLALPTTRRILLTRTMASSTGHLSVAREIRIDHDNVRDLFDRFKQATDLSERYAIANTIIREVAVHGDAEEISVYNEMQKLGLADTVAHDKEEHATIKRLFYEVDDTSVKDEDFGEVLTRAINAFVAHAEEEEKDQLPLIESKLSPEENDRYAREFLKARKMVPTRPHPAAPQTGGIAQKAAGLQGSLHDKIVEKLGNRQFVDLKYTHPEI